MSYTAAVLTGAVDPSALPRTLIVIVLVSDTASKDVHADKSGPVALEVLNQNGFVVSQQLVLPDDEEAVRACVREWCERGDISWVVTTGGTGFGLRDKTPEVCLAHTHDSSHLIEL
jgi:gephyrin